MNHGYLRSVIKERKTFTQTCGGRSQGTTYRLVYFDDLNRVHIYSMKNTHYSRKYRPKWNYVGVLPINP